MFHVTLTRKRKVSVPSLEAASRACRDYIAQHDLGNRTWLGGDVLDAQTGEIIARVSYNGRVWPPEDYFPGQQPLL